MKILIQVVAMFCFLCLSTPVSALYLDSWEYTSGQSADITYYERTDSTDGLSINGTAVGPEDTLLASVTVNNKYEFDFLAEVLGLTFDPDNYLKDENMGDSSIDPYPWLETGVDGVFAYDFVDNTPPYFLVKLGGGGDDVLATHFIYSNFNLFAVVNLADFGDVDEYRISHIGAPVPEPSTLLLLGSGLIGFAVYRRRRK